MLMSICIPSYNRPNELLRCLESIPTQFADRVEILVRDDCSPRQQEIVDLISGLDRPDIQLHAADQNVGFDTNFYHLINSAKGRFLIFFTDDDYAVPVNFPRFLDFLENHQPHVCVTPYVDLATGKIERSFDRIIVNEKAKLLPGDIFDFILLSGLTIRRDMLFEYDFSRIRDSIYSQVYVFIMACGELGPSYYDEPIIIKGEDGENGFSNTLDPLKSDRKNYLSNLSFHKGLISVIKLADSQLIANGRLLRKFTREYSLRSFTGMIIARSHGRLASLKYLKLMKKLPIKTGVLPYIYLVIIMIFGVRGSFMISKVPMLILKKLRKVKR